MFSCSDHRQATTRALTRCPLVALVVHRQQFHFVEFVSIFEMDHGMITGFSHAGYPSRYTSWMAEAGHCAGQTEITFQCISDSSKYKFDKAAMMFRVDTCYIYIHRINGNFPRMNINYQLTCTLQFLVCGLVDLKC
jgi:hypothetical protein